MGQLRQTGSPLIGLTMKGDEGLLPEDIVHPQPLGPDRLVLRRGSTDDGVQNLDATGQTLQRRVWPEAAPLDW